MNCTESFVAQSTFRHVSDPSPHAKRSKRPSDEHARRITDLVRLYAPIMEISPPSTLIASSSPEAAGKVGARIKMASTCELTWRNATPRNAGGGAEGEQIVVLVDGLLFAVITVGGREAKGRIDRASDRSIVAIICLLVYRCSWSRSLYRSVTL